MYSEKLKKWDLLLLPHSTLYTTENVYGTLPELEICLQKRAGPKNMVKRIVRPLVRFSNYWSNFIMYLAGKYFTILLDNRLLLFFSLLSCVCKDL